jgi:KipI family sensor histidine kinase inhibitor
MPSEFPVIVAQGVTGIVVRFSDRLTEAGNRATLAFRDAVEAAEIDGVEECASALGSVLVRFDPLQSSFDLVAGQLRKLLDQNDFYAAPLPPNRRLWRIPAVFGGVYGPSLEDAATRAGLTTEEAIHDLTSSRLRVMALGFAPGQPYLGELPEPWNFPRLQDLINVPEGAIAAAIRQLVLFANDSPTGWAHVGQTAFRCFRPEDERSIPLRPGDEVKFDAITPEAFEALRARDPSGGGATFEVLP